MQEVYRTSDSLQSGGVHEAGRDRWVMTARVVGGRLGLAQGQAPRKQMLWVSGRCGLLAIRACFDLVAGLDGYLLPADFLMS